MAQDSKVRQRRRQAKAARRRARFGARISTDYLGNRSRRTGRRGRRLSEKQKMELTDRGAAKLLDEVAKLPEPRAARAGQARAAEHSRRHREQWAEPTPERRAA